MKRRSIFLLVILSFFLNYAAVFADKKRCEALIPQLRREFVRKAIKPQRIVCEPREIKQ